MSSQSRGARRRASVDASSVCVLLLDGKTGALETIVGELAGPASGSSSAARRQCRQPVRRQPVRRQPRRSELRRAGWRCRPTARRRCLCTLIELTECMATRRRRGTRRGGSGRGGGGEEGGATRSRRRRRPFRRMRIRRRRGGEEEGEEEGKRGRGAAAAGRGGAGGWARGRRAVQVGAAEATRGATRRLRTRSPTAPSPSPCMAQSHEEPLFVHDAATDQVCGPMRTGATTAGGAPAPCSSCPYGPCEGSLGVCVRTPSSAWAPTWQRPHLFE